MTHTQHEPDPVYALAAVAPATFVAGRASGLYRSEDGGVSWQPLIGGPGAAVQPLVSAVAVASGEGLEQTLFAGGQGSLLRSGDGGLRWQTCVLPQPPPLITSIAVSPAFVHDGIVLAGTAEDGVFRSADRGDRWASWNFGLLDLRIMALAISPAFASDEIVYAAAETGLFRSTDGGRAWREMTLTEHSEPVLSLALSPDFGANGLLYAGTESAGLFRSFDRGKNWQYLPEIDTGGQPINGLAFISPATMVVALADQLLLLSDAHTAQPQPSLLLHADSVTAFAIGTDQKGIPMLVVADAAGRILPVGFPDCSAHG